MNKVIYLACLVMLFSCQKPGFRIYGKVSDVEDGTMLYLKLVGPPAVAIDSTVIKKGVYRFKGGDTPKPIWATLSFKNKFVPLADLYLENGDIRVSGERYQSTVTGTRTNEENLIFNRDVNPLYDVIGSLHTTLSQYTGNSAQVKDSLKNEIKLKNEQLEQAEMNFIRTYPASVLSLRLLNFKSARMTGKQLKDAIAILDTCFNNDPQVIRMRAYAEDLNRTEEGVSAPDFTVTAEDGSSFTLSAERGKYILLDFWASWCAPCRNEFPNIARLEKKYGGEKFKVIGISLDKNLDRWKQALKEEGCSWLQLSDQNGKIAKQYAVLTIPHIVLISPDGKIVSKGLRKEALADKLDEIFGNSSTRGN